MTLRILARLGLVVGVAWLLLAFGTRACHAQVAPVVQLVHGQASTPVVNPSRVAMRVTVVVARDTATRDRIGRPVAALVSPAAFQLAPGERQLVRMRVRETFPSGTVLRLVITLTPVSPPGAGTRLVLVSRLASKLLVLP